MNPYYEKDGITLYNADCIAAMRDLPSNSVDSIVTDPPYGLSFMGRKWDVEVPSVEVWQECLRVLKPGGHLLSFAGTRTQHRMAVNIEDAGFEIRDMIAWIYGSGFPKNLDVGKSLDSMEKNKWLNVVKAVGSASVPDILESWKECSSTARSAGRSSLTISEKEDPPTHLGSIARPNVHTRGSQGQRQSHIQSESGSVSNAGKTSKRNKTEAGANTPKGDSVPVRVLLQANPENSSALAVIAELCLIEARHTNGASCSSVRLPAERSTTELSDRAVSAASSPESQEVRLSMPDSSALQSAWGCQGESMAGRLKGVEALKTWLGSSPSSRKADTNALCAALTDDLKHIMLSQSKTFRSYGTTQKTDCASAISATITEYTAEHLISFTVDTLRSSAIDKAAGAEREVVGLSSRHGGGKRNGYDYGAGKQTMGNAVVPDITAPATEAARQWEGWGTALKPAMEMITMARKPFKGTVAANVLEHGTGAINVDGCRVGHNEECRMMAPSQANIDSPSEKHRQAGRRTATLELKPQGRYPANLIHDGSDEVVRLFPDAGGGFGKRGGRENATVGDYGMGATMEVVGFGDAGSAARFFYCAKADKSERRNSKHPTVKPLDLMRYLVRMVTPVGATVLDPFAGSGTTIEAAMREHCHCIGIEREQEYCDDAVRRLTQRGLF